MSTGRSAARTSPEDIWPKHRYCFKLCFLFTIPRFSRGKTLETRMLAQVKFAVG